MSEKSTKLLVFQEGVVAGEEASAFQKPIQINIKLFLQCNLLATKSKLWKHWLAGILQYHNTKKLVVLARNGAVIVLFSGELKEFIT